MVGRRHGLVSSKHNDERVLLNPWVSRAHGLLGRAPRRTIVLSDHVARFIREHGRIPAERLVRIYYGHDPAPFERAAAESAGARAETRAEFGWAPEDLVAICVARFAPQKAHDVLLEAFALARAGEPRLKLLLVGEDPFGDGRERAEAVARRLELGGSVRFTGMRRDVARLMAASDLFVMSSLWEGFGLVFLEAMSSGIPVLATRVSAVPEVIEDQVTGVLVGSGDARALAEGLLGLARDPARRAALGRAGKARVRERFELDRMVEQTLAVYRDLA
jgi:glycosyltransferase involved in cell wall biosynthesis